MPGLRYSTRIGALLASALLTTFALAGCSSNGKSSSASGGTFTYCTDPTYPPAEFYQAARLGGAEISKTLVGADIDIGKDVAKRLGANAEFDTMPFSQVVDSLLAKKCDGIISFMNDTAERQQQMEFADYVAAGQTVLVKNGSPVIHNVNDLFGKTVSVASGTTQEEFLTSENKSAGARQPIKIVSFPDDDAAIYALTKGTAQVYFGDAPVVSRLVSENSTLTAGPELVKPVPVGIALRKGDTRLGQVKKAISDMYADGTMGRILAQWKMTQFAISP